MVRAVMSTRHVVLATATGSSLRIRALRVPFFMGCWAGLQGIERGVCLKFLVSFLGGAPDVFGFF